MKTKVYTIFYFDKIKYITNNKYKFHSSKNIFLIYRRIDF